MPNPHHLLQEIEKELMEQLADIEHQRWADWQKHVHSKCGVDVHGNLIIPMALVDRWEEQIFAKYEDLSEEDKEKDRVQVRRYLPLFTQSLERYGKGLMEEAKKRIAKEKVTVDYPDTEDGRKCRHENSLYNSALDSAIKELESLI